MSVSYTHLDVYKRQHTHTHTQVFSGLADMECVINFVGCNQLCNQSHKDSMRLNFFQCFHQIKKAEKNCVFHVYNPTTHTVFLNIFCVGLYVSPIQYQYLQLQYL